MMFNFASIMFKMLTVIFHFESNLVLKKENLEGIVHSKCLFCHLLILHLFQTCMSFFLLLNTKEDVLKNVGKQAVDGSH